MNVYKHARPKGFAAWQPQSATAKVIADVKSVIEQYRDHLPLTVRQIFYRLVATTNYPKTDRGYANLCEYLVRARRAGLIAFDVIRDDGWTKTSSQGWLSTEDFLHAVENSACQYRRDRQANQPGRVLILVEAAGMLPQIQRVADDYSIEVMTSSGFDSLTAKKQLADMIDAEKRPVAVLHVGDYDPSGVCIFDSVAADVKAFTRSRHAVSFERIAITPAQISVYKLPTAPAKKTDRRGNGISDTCQAEALPPDVLALEIQRAIEAKIDRDILENDIAEERHERDELIEAVKALRAA